MINLETRGKKSDGNWVHGIYLWYLETPQILYKNVDSAKIGTLVEVTKDTISMNTGYIDAERRPIFEGDILGLKLNGEDKLRVFGIVRWNEGGYFYIDDSFLLFNNTTSHRPIGEMLDYVKKDNHTFHVMGNRWDHPDLIPEVYRKTPKEEPKEEPKVDTASTLSELADGQPKEPKEKTLSDDVETDEYGNVYVPVGGVIPYPFRSGPVEFHLECVEDNSIACSDCALKERNCSSLLCNVNDRKDHKNVSFKIFRRFTF